MNPKTQDRWYALALVGLLSSCGSSPGDTALPPDRADDIGGTGGWNASGSSGGGSSTGGSSSGGSSTGGASTGGASTGGSSTGGSSTGGSNTGGSSTGGSSTGGSNTGGSSTGGSSTGGSSTGGSSTGGSSTDNPDFFFGYFTYDNHLAELEGHSNVVLGWSTMSFIEEAKSRNIKPIVWLSTILPLWDFAGGKAYLKSNYLDIWNEYAQQLAPHIDDIYGFYPVDEPFWGSKLTASEQDALNLAIKASFPNKPIMTTFARPTIDDPGFVVPVTYDYVGYDNYYGASFADDKLHYEVLKSKLSPGQKIFLIGDAFANAFTVTQAEQELKANKIHLAYELATTPGEPVVGILNYVWDSFSENWPGTGGSYYLGLRDMPIAKEQFISVGQAIVGGAVPPPDPPDGQPPTGTVVVDPPLVSDTQIGLVWQPVAGATEYAVLWSSVLGNGTMSVTTAWAIIDTDTSVDHWISIFPCNQAGCGDPTYLGPIKKP